MRTSHTIVLQEKLMAKWHWMSLIVGASAVLTACASGDIDYSQQRAISEDIDAAYYNGPTSLNPGENPREEPEGAYPWLIK
jgi:hypothetical protein